VRSINGLPLRFISGRTCSAPQRPLIYSRAEPPYRPQDSAYGRDDAPPSRSRPRSRSGSPIAGGIRRGVAAIAVAIALVWMAVSVIAQTGQSDSIIPGRVRKNVVRLASPAI
jgi:hypothetical protein